MIFIPFKADRFIIQTQSSRLKQLLFLLLLIPVFSLAQPVKLRAYKNGEHFKYRLSTQVYRNGSLSSKTETISSHKVLKEDHHFSEEVAFIQKAEFGSKDTVNLDSLAMKVKPYRVSLSPKGKVLLPKLVIPGMTGDITDLNTFYVAVSPALKAHKLNKHDSMIVMPELRQGNFADSIEILKGTDCLQVTQRLISENKDFTVVETSFTPPESFCLSPLQDTIATKAGDHFNNIQFIRNGKEGKVNLFWGTESFIITSSISKANGQVLEASMENILTLRMRYNCSPDLQSWAAELPVNIRRVLKLELIR